LDKGRSIHGEIEKKAASSSSSSTEDDALALGNAAVDMYAKCGAVAEAQHLLDGLGRRDAISWSSLIGGYVQRGWNEGALRRFEEMKIEGLSPDAVTYSHVLKACGGIGAIEKGKETHDEVSSKGLLRSDAKLGAALVDMYVKCGDLRSARKALEELPEKSVAAWNALIAGYAQHGQAEDALECLDRMLRDDQMSPDSITYVCVLNACAHAALVDEAQMRFAAMIGSSGLMPSSEHYACIVNLFGRVGHFEIAAAVATSMPSLDHRPIWSALLGACQSGGNRNLGRLVFQHAVQMDADHCASYVSLSNLYASEDAADNPIRSCAEDR
jgi:pentatricopeptide repeat protein